MKASAYMFSKRFQKTWVCAALAIGCLVMLAHPAAESDGANARLIPDSSGSIWGQPEHVEKIVIVKAWVQAEASLSSPCDDPNRISNPHNGHCYQKITAPMTWHAAKEYCERLGGYLATVTSREERDFVYRRFKDATHFLWLGGTDEAEEGHWKWVTGEPWTYNDWPQGLPDNYAHRLSPCQPENYLHVIFRDYDFLRGGRWNDTHDTAHEDWGIYGQHDNIPLCEWESVIKKEHAETGSGKAIRDSNS